jgi:hypothetical protein
MPNIFSSLAEAFDPMRLNAAAKMLSENQENVAFRESHGGQSLRTMQMDTEALALEDRKKDLMHKGGTRAEREKLDILTRKLGLGQTQHSIDTLGDRQGVDTLDLERQMNDLLYGKLTRAEREKFGNLTRKLGLGQTQHSIDTLDADQNLADFKRKQEEFLTTLYAKQNLNAVALEDVVARETENRKNLASQTALNIQQREAVLVSAEYKAFKAKEQYTGMTDEQALPLYQKISPVLNTIQEAKAKGVIPQNIATGFELIALSDPDGAGDAIKSYIIATNKDAITQENNTVADQYKNELVRLENLTTLEELGVAQEKYKDAPGPVGEKLRKTIEKRMEDLKLLDTGAKLVDTLFSKTIKSFGEDLPAGLDPVGFTDKFFGAVKPEQIQALKQSSAFLGGVDEKDIGALAFKAYQNFHETEAINTKTSAENKRRGIGNNSNPSGVLIDGVVDNLSGPPETLAREAFGGSSSVVMNGTRYFALEGSTDLATMYADQKGGPMIALAKRANKGGVWGLAEGELKEIPYSDFVLDRLFPTRDIENQIGLVGPMLNRFEASIAAAEVPKETKVKLGLMLRSLQLSSAKLWDQVGPDKTTHGAPPRFFAKDEYDEVQQEILLKNIANLHGTMLMLLPSTRKKNGQ